MIGVMDSTGHLGEWPDKPPLAHQLMVTIRALVAAGAPIGLSQQVDDALYGSDLDMSDVIRGFMTGDVVGPITPGSDENEWTCTVVAPVLRHPPSRRQIGIVTVVISASSLLVGQVSG